MKRLPHLLLALCLALPAWALDPAPLVKVTPLLKTTTSWDGKPIVYPPGQAEVTALGIELAPGGETGWHLHPVPSFAWLLEGELEVRRRDGGTRRFRAGEALAEVVAVWHNGRNVGTGPVKLVVFYAGAEGLALTQREP